jgi:hypothetical protein
MTLEPAGMPSEEREGRRNKRVDDQAAPRPEPLIVAAMSAEDVQWKLYPNLPRPAATAASRP